jgi:transposase
VPKAGPKKIDNYGDRFKATAVKLSSLPGVQVKDVAAALDIHPFMLSLWRKQVRQRMIVARASKLDVETTAELRRLKELERRCKVARCAGAGRNESSPSTPTAELSTPAQRSSAVLPSSTSPRA